MTMTIDGEDWLLDGIVTLEHCNEAEAFLHEAIVKIQSQLEEPRDIPGWERKARFALNIKKRVLHLVEQKRGDIRRASAQCIQNRIIERVKLDHPVWFEQLIRSL